MGRAPQKNKRIIKTYVYETFYRKFGVVLCPFEKVKNKEKSDKCEINCRPSVLRSPTVLWCLFVERYLLKLLSIQTNKIEVVN